MNLPDELRNLKKGLINIKNKDQKCFLWCHVRHINPSKEHPERIRKVYKKLVKSIINPEEIVYVQEITDLCFTKQKIKTKKGFVEVVYSVLVVKMH